MKDNREYRNLLNFEQKDNFIIEGYATTWEPYILYQDGDHVVYEQISKDAFKDADFSDCVLRVDHVGRVFARKSNGTLSITLDNKGMFVRADLSKTQSARDLYEEIKAEMLVKMSWAFSVSKEHYDAKTSIRHIDAVSKVWDASVVVNPQNSATSVSARSAFDGLIRPQIVEYEARTALVDEYMRKVANI